MDNHTLETLATIITPLSDQGTTVFIIYVLTSHLVPTIGWLITLILCIKYCITPCIRNLSAARDLGLLRNLLNIGTSGPLSD